MTIKEIFAADVTRNIAPVVYFHEQDPAKVLEEVSEYIITGGYPETDPRHKRVQSGIHEQFVKLLQGIAEELPKRGGVELPASWISGFYGSGKSSFAKLLGLALNGLILPNNLSLVDTLLSRDDSPKRHELLDSWNQLRNQIDPIAVVFDIGAVARDDEDIHSAVKRQIQLRLGYCTISHYVASKEPELRNLFQQHRSDLKLYGYQCDAITEEDFVEVYPMLPGYVDLLMQITSNLRTRSSRAKGDDHAIRGLLQLLGELFREQKLGEKPIGDLVTLENIYAVQQSALDADVQNTLARLFNHEKVVNDDLAIKVAKAVSLLELIQEQEPTTSTLVSQCLYSRLGMGNQETEITQALEKLRDLGLLSYSDKLGYKIQSSAGQEWQRDRDQYSVIPDAITIIVAEKLKTLLGGVKRPNYKTKPFTWMAIYSDGRQRQDERLQSTNDVTYITVDFRYLTDKKDQESNYWIPQSSNANLQNRLVWVVGTSGDLVSLIKELAKSRHIIQKYEGRQQSISSNKQRLYYEEKSRCEKLETDVQNAIAHSFLEGQIYFRGRQIDKTLHGSTFNSILTGVGESILPELYSHYNDVAITPEELKQLLEANLSGPSHKFMSENGLGILELDAGKYVPTCSGEVPTRISQYIQQQNGIAGNNLLNYFGGPPYGYSADVVKTCLAGLLRAGKVRIRPQAGSEITSVRDPGAVDIFTKDREIKRADILPPNETNISPRDRIALCKLFKDSLDVELDRENDAIADAAFQQFPGLVKRLQEIEKRYNRLPNRPELPQVLQKLREALEKCTISRQVENTVITVKKYLDALRDGIQQLGIIETDLTDTAVAEVAKAVEIQTHQVAQLREIESIAEIQNAIAALETQLNTDRPWRDINSLQPQIQAIEQHYKTIRLQLIERQEQQSETIKNKIKQRSGFNKLNEKQAEYITRPLQQAAFDTTKDALYPSLLQLRDSAVIQIQKAEETVNRNLDDMLSEVTEKQIIQLDLNLKGYEVNNAEEVEALVNRIRERLLAQLKENTRIRII